MLERAVAWFLRHSFGRTPKTPGDTVRPYLNPLWALLLITPLLLSRAVLLPRKILRPYLASQLPR